ncbi:unnamed protein product [Ranitomeya imitator]|uniref:Suppressor of cytokine signaling 2 n=1 Tax=Ranitomeya imitator TaxID=111125 RepID=A0ABN9M2Q3_9NEOB|nr:unnamed protein product [Ranitomeya imitator]
MSSNSKDTNDTEPKAADGARKIRSDRKYTNNAEQKDADAARKRKQRANKSTEERCKRLDTVKYTNDTEPKAADGARNIRSDNKYTNDAERKAADAARKHKQRANETTEDRHKRLDPVNAACNKRITNESFEDKTNRLSNKAAAARSQRCKHNISTSSVIDSANNTASLSPFIECVQLEAPLTVGKSARWYWGHMTVNEAKEKLQDASEGTFLVRDSSHTDYLLTISVKTSAGPTNLRIEYREGKFRLDSVVCIRSRLKQFDSVVHLIEYYVLLSKNKKMDAETLPNRTVHLWLVKPLYTSTPSLQHLCRMAVNKCTNKIHELPLPTRLKEYITEYRYHV